jgi:hypothetical protein
MIKIYFSKPVSSLQHYIVGQSEISSDVQANPKLMTGLEIGYFWIKINAGLCRKKTALIGVPIEINASEGEETHSAKNPFMSEPDSISVKFF